LIGRWLYRSQLHRAQCPYASATALIASDEASSGALSSIDPIPRAAALKPEMGRIRRRPATPGTRQE
jgi:hypothetical protein